MTRTGLIASVGPAIFETAFMSVGSDVFEFDSSGNGGGASSGRLVVIAVTSSSA